MALTVQKALGGVVVLSSADVRHQAPVLRAAPGLLGQKVIFEILVGGQGEL